MKLAVMSQQVAPVNVLTGIFRTLVSPLRGFPFFVYLPRPYGLGYARENRALSPRFPPQHAQNRRVPGTPASGLRHGIVCALHATAKQCRYRRTAQDIAFAGIK